MTRFNAFRLAFLPRGGGGGGGGAEYNLEYAAQDKFCAVRGRENQALITARDASHEVVVADNRDQSFCSVTIESAGRFLMLLQTKKGSVVLKCRESAMQELQGKDYLSLFLNQEETLRTDIFPDFTRFGLTTLDPFNEGIVDLISQTLSKGLPDDFDPDVPVTADEARVFPALVDETYLKALHDRTKDADRKRLLSDRMKELIK